MLKGQESLPRGERTRPGAVGWIEHSERPQRDGKRLADKLLLGGTAAGRGVEGASYRRVPARSVSCMIEASQRRAFRATLRCMYALASFLRPLLSGESLYYELATASQKTEAASLIGL